MKVKRVQKEIAGKGYKPTICKDSGTDRSDIRLVKTVYKNTFSRNMPANVKKTHGGVYHTRRGAGVSQEHTHPADNEGKKCVGMKPDSEQYSEEDFGETAGNIEYNKNDPPVTVYFHPSGCKKCSSKADMQNTKVERNNYEGTRQSNSSREGNILLTGEEESRGLVNPTHTQSSRSCKATNCSITNNVENRKNGYVKNQRTNMNIAYEEEKLLREKSGDTPLLHPVPESQEHFEIKYNVESSVMCVTLPDGKSLGCLIDSGASFSLISREVINSSTYLGSLPVQTIDEPKDLKIGDGNYIQTTEVISPNIIVQGQKLNITCYIIENAGAFPMVLGIQTMRDLKCKVDFVEGTLRIKRTRIAVKPIREYILKPNKTTLVAVMAKMPKQIRKLSLLMEINPLYRDMAPDLSIVEFSKGIVPMLMYNPHEYNVIIKPSDKIGNLTTNHLNEPFFAIQTSNCGVDEGIYYKTTAPASTNTKTKKGEVGSHGVHFRQLNIGDLPKQYESHSAPSKGRPTQEKILDPARSALKVLNMKKYPFLEESDSRLTMTDDEIIRRDINMTNSRLSTVGKARVMKIMRENKDALSLHGEVGDCKDSNISFKVKDETGFFIRPFRFSYQEKETIEKEIDKLVKMKIIEKGESNFISPAFLVKRKDPQGIERARLVIDFRKLNQLIIRPHYAQTLVKDAIHQIGQSMARFLSVLDVRSAFHSLYLAKGTKHLTGIQFTNDTNTYVHNKLPQGLHLSPLKFQQYMSKCLEDIPDYRKKIFPFMDDLLILSETEEEHISIIRDVMECMKRHGLKFSPPKIQVAPETLNYMGYVISYDKTDLPVISIDKDKCQAIRKLNSPRTVRQIKSFAGMVNFLSSFCPKLQELLKPIYELTKNKNKTRTLKWEAIHEENFNKIKELIQQAPVLGTPNKNGKFILYVDSSRLATGGSLWQIQNGKETLLGYHSKALPESHLRFSVSELELAGLYLNIHAFRSLLAGVEFKVFTDHISLVNILKSKTEPSTLRIKKYVEKLSSYAFDLNYMAGNKLYISDTLSRNYDKEEDGEDKVKTICFCDIDKTAATTAISQIILKNEEHYDYQREIVPAIDHIIRTCPETFPYLHLAVDKPHKYDEGRTCAAVTRSMSKHRGLTIENTQKEQKQKKSKESAPLQMEKRDRVQYQDGHVTNKRPTMDTDINREVRSAEVLTTGEQLEEPSCNRPRHIGGLDLFLPKPMEQNQIQQENRLLETLLKDKMNLSNPRIAMDVAQRGNNNPFDYEVSQEFNTNYSDEKATALFEQAKKGKSINFKITKQRDIDSLMDIIQSRSLEQYYLTFDIQKLMMEQRNDPYYGDIYKFLESSKLPTAYSEAKRVKHLAGDYFLYRNVLYKYNIDVKNSIITHKLCIPEVLVNHVLEMAHTSLFASHRGRTRCYLTLKKKYDIKNLMEKINEFIKVCVLCQERKVPQGRKYMLKPRLHPDLAPFQFISMDVKKMPLSSEGHIGILVILCETTHYLKARPIKHETAEEIANIFIEEVLFQSGRPRQVTTDLHRSFSGKVMSYITKALGIKIHFVSPESHHTSMVERYIGSLQNALIANLRNKGTIWPTFLKPALYALNTAGTNSLEGYSPYHILYKTEPPAMDNFQMEPPEPFCSTVKEYLEQVKDKFKHVEDTLKETKQRQQRAQCLQSAREHNIKATCKGDLVYLLAPDKTQLFTNNKKIKLSYCGPFIVYEVIDSNKIMLQDLAGRLLRNVFSIRRIKQAYIKDKNGKVLTNKASLMSSLKENLNPLSNELEKGLLEDYLIFNDNKGNEHDKPEGYMVYQYTDVPSVGLNIKDLNQNGAKSIEKMNKYFTHMQQNQPEHSLMMAQGMQDHITNIVSKTTNNENRLEASQYEVKKARFKDGQLELLLQKVNEGTNSPQVLWLNIEESSNLRPAIDQLLSWDIKITGKPSKRI
jgi:hypothetical protein